MNTTTKKAANSIVGKLTAGILAAAAVAAATFAAPAAAFQGGGESVLVVGDSLEVGSGPYLRAALPGVSLDVDAERGRTTGQGLRALAARLGPEHGVVAFPLGTNDSPSDPAGLAANLAAAAELAGDRCMVVATIARPRLRGVSAAGLNRVVESFAGQTGAQVMDWRSAASTPGMLGRDGVHATGQGYALRASLLAEAVQGCLLGVGPSGIPAPRDPQARPPADARRAERRPGRVEARPALLPSLAPLGALAARFVAPVAAALRSAATAATRSGPEPVLGAP
jgi:lysophospholipase L1-like esterase